MYQSNTSLFFNDPNKINANHDFLSINEGNILRSGDNIQLTYSNFPLQCKFNENNKIMSERNNNIVLDNIIIYKSNDIGTRDDIVRDNDVIVIISATSQKIIGKYIVKNLSNFNSVIMDGDILSLILFSDLVRYTNFVKYSCKEQKILKLKVFQLKIIN